MNYDELITLENLFSAWDEFKRGKQDKPDVLQFERNLEDNIFALYEELITKTYTHQPYHTFHIYDPKFRVINKAQVRDRVVHHLLFKYLERLWQKRFIHQSYSCQKGKGIHQGVEDIDRALCTVSCNYTRSVWALKMDIKKFFDSVDQEILLALLFKQVQDQDIHSLFTQIVTSFASPQGTGKGMPIGNLTSQIFANIYLSELDYFVKFNLKERYYFRYADDFMILHNDRAHLGNSMEILIAFIKSNLALTVHPQKIILRKFRQGIDFIGYVVRPHYRILRTKTRKRMFKKLRKRIEVFNKGLFDEYALNQSVQSYFGVLQHCSGYIIGERLQNEIWLSKQHKL